MPNNIVLYEEGWYFVLPATKGVSVDNDALKLKCDRSCEMNRSVTRRSPESYVLQFLTPIQEHRALSML